MAAHARREARPSSSPTAGIAYLARWAEGRQMTADTAMAFARSDPTTPFEPPRCPERLRAHGNGGIEPPGSLAIFRFGLF